MDDAFKVTFGCENCGEMWDETYPPRWVVGQPERHDRVMAYDKDCTKMMVECDRCHTVRCPTCELLNPVEVRDREPLEEGDDGAEEGREATA